MLEACTRMREVPCRWFACTSVLNSLENVVTHLHEVHAQRGARNMCSDCSVLNIHSAIDLYVGCVWGELRDLDIAGLSRGDARTWCDTVPISRPGPDQLEHFLQSGHAPPPSRSRSVRTRSPHSSAASSASSASSDSSNASPSPQNSPAAPHTVPPQPPPCPSASISPNHANSGSGAAQHGARTRGPSPWAPQTHSFLPDADTGGLLAQFNMSRSFDYMPSFSFNVGYNFEASSQVHLSLLFFLKLVLIHLCAFRARVFCVRCSLRQSLPRVPVLRVKATHPPSPRCTPMPRRLPDLTSGGKGAVQGRGCVARG
jgi:hypothetical protein